MNNLDTAALCARQGICFKPLVTESTGAWDAEVRIFQSLTMLHSLNSAVPSDKTRLLWHVHALMQGALQFCTPPDAGILNANLYIPCCTVHDCA